MLELKFNGIWKFFNSVDRRCKHPRLSWWRHGWLAVIFCKYGIRSINFWSVDFNSTHPIILEISVVTLLRMLWRTLRNNHGFVFVLVFKYCGKRLGSPANCVIERNATTALNLGLPTLFRLSGLVSWVPFVASAHHWCWTKPLSRRKCALMLN